MEKNLNTLKSFILYGIILVVAVVSGIAIGSIYVNGKTPSYDMSAMSEELLRGDEEEIAKLYEDAISGRKTSFSAVELYQVAEYKLKQTDRYVKVLSGQVSSGEFNINVTQDMLSNKIVTEEGITYLKMSPANSSFAPSMAVKQQYFYANPDVVILNETRNRDDILGDSIENYRLDLDSSTEKVWTREQYKTFFNTDPTTPLTYIVSDITCNEGLYDTNITLGNDGTYTFKIKINGAYASAAALYYSYEIRHFSEEVIPTTPPTSSQLPSWKSVEMTVQVDSNFNFLNIDYVENYSVYKFGVNAGVTDRFSDVFYYDEETIQEYLELI